MIFLSKIGVVLLVGLLSCNGGDKNKAVTAIEKDRPIKKIRLKDLNGQPINLEKYKGEAIFINFWATWCKPCLQEMPSIQAAMNKLKNENIIFLFASDEESDQIENFKTNYNYNFNYVKVENFEELSIMTLPTTYIFDPKGKLVFSEMGYRKWDDKQNIDLILNIVKAK